MEFWISQILGLVVSVVAIASMQFENISRILICQIICNGVGAISYIAVGGLSGCTIYLVALSQVVVYYILRKKYNDVPVWVGVCFVSAYILCSVTTYKTPKDLISALASLTCALGLLQGKASIYRIFMLLNGLIWMIYDFSAGAYTMIISHVATAVSATVGMVRLDMTKKNL